MIAPLLRFLFHIAFLVPIFYGRYYLAAAMLLLVAACYIKVQKISMQLAEVKSKPEQDDLRKARRRWLSLTYLSPKHYDSP